MLSALKKRLARHFPASLPAEDLAHEEHRILALFLAGREKLPLKDWLRHVLETAIVERGREYCSAHGLDRPRVLGSMFGRDAEASSEVPRVDARNRRDAEPQPFRSGIHGILELLSDQLEDEIEACPASQQPKKPKRARGQLQFYKEEPKVPTSADRQYWHKALLARGPMRPLARVTPAMLEAVEQLHAVAPNFAEPIRWIAGSLRLALNHGNRLLDLPPLLLVGPTGTGKTWFAEQLAKALKVHSVMQPLPAVTASWVFSGSSGWHSSEPGIVTKVFLSPESLHASPMLILDELDKPTKGHQYDAVSPLLGLLDKRQAQRWKDEFFGVEFDASRMLIVATANSLAPISEPMRSRFRIFHISKASTREMPAMVRSAWAEFRALHRQYRLPAQLDEAIVARLASRPANGRAIGELFWEMVTRAARRPGPLKPTVEDLEDGTRLRVVGPDWQQGPAS